MGATWGDALDAFERRISEQRAALDLGEVGEIAPFDPPVGLGTLPGELRDRAELLLAESIDVVRQLTELGIAPAAIVVNRRSPHDAGALLAERREQEARHLAVLQDAVAGIPITELPLLAGDLAGSEALAALADHLTASPTR